MNKDEHLHEGQEKRSDNAEKFTRMPSNSSSTPGVGQGPSTRQSTWTPQTLELGIPLFCLAKALAPLLASELSKSAEARSVSEEDVEVKEAAKLMGRHKSFVYRLIYDGLLRARKVGGRILVKKSDLSTALASITTEVK